MRLEVDEAAVAWLTSQAPGFLSEITDEIERDAIRLAPVDTGRLKSTIHADKTRLGAGTCLVWCGGLGLDGQWVDYWEWQEYGAAPHVIRPREPNGLLVFYWPVLGRVVGFKKVNHPGNDAQPFMRPALYKDRS